MRSLLLIPVGLLALLFSSCGEYPCGRAELNFSLVGFTNAEADTIIIRRKQPGNISSGMELFTFNAVNLYRSNDTLNLGLSPYLPITSNYDYEIEFPGAAKTIRITDILEEQKHGKKNGPKIYCLNPITSLKVNGLATTPSNWNHIYIAR